MRLRVEKAMSPNPPFHASPLPVLIVGAGPTGLAMAIELARQGIPFRLIDKADHAAQWSQVLGVQARTLEQLERYGIAEGLRRLAHDFPFRPRTRATVSSPTPKGAVA